MIKYGTTELNVKPDSLSIAKGNRTKIRKYPGRDISDFFDLGKMATKVACTLIAKSENDRITYEQLLHTPVKRQLILNDRNEYYKNVIPDPKFKVDIIGMTATGYYLIPARFIALDPVPYDVETGQVMY